MFVWRNIENNQIFINSIPNPDFPHFYYMLGGNLGSFLYGDVTLMVLNSLLQSLLSMSSKLYLKLVSSYIVDNVN